MISKRQVFLKNIPAETMNALVKKTGEVMMQTGKPYSMNEVINDALSKKYNIKKIPVIEPKTSSTKVAEIESDIFDRAEADAKAKKVGAHRVVMTILNSYLGVEITKKTL